MLRVVLGGPDLGRFRSSGAGDERLLVVFPPAGSFVPPAPVRLADGTLDYPDRATCPPMRSYTVRGWDPAAAEMTLDFVLHPGGVAAPWAIRAQPGDVVYVTEATGWYAPPAGARWQVLLADLTGLPALGAFSRTLHRHCPPWRLQRSSRPPIGRPGRTHRQQRALVDGHRKRARPKPAARGSA